jgi:integrase
MTDVIDWDDKLPGFGLRTRDGKRSWVYQYKLDGKNHRLKLGGPELSRKQALELANDAKAQLARAKRGIGVDPATERDQRKADVKPRSRGNTLSATIPIYLKAREGSLRKSSHWATKKYLEAYWKPLHDLALTKIGRADVATILADRTKKNGPIAANRARSAISGLFAWAIGEGICETNPVIGTNKRKENGPRERSLSDAEAAAVWLAAPDKDYGRLIKLIVLTGCRRGELGRLKWSEIDLEARTITLPRERTKNGKEHVVPLSGPAMDILVSIGRREREYVFGRSHGKGFAGWAKAKQDLDAVLTLDQPWTVHDLRRTVRTGLGKLGVQPHIAEATLNHLPPKLIRTYDRNTYADEKRSALDKWASHLKVCVAQATGANVTALRKGDSAGSRKS